MQNCSVPRAAKGRNCASLPASSFFSVSLGVVSGLWYGTGTVGERPRIQVFPTHQDVVDMQYLLSPVHPHPISEQPTQKCKRACLPLVGPAQGLSSRDKQTLRHFIILRVPTETLWAKFINRCNSIEVNGITPGLNLTLQNLPFSFLKLCFPNPYVASSDGPFLLEVLLLHTKLYRCQGGNKILLCCRVFQTCQCPK